jgi:hypothetical protein
MAVRVVGLLVFISLVQCSYGANTWLWVGGTTNVSDSRNWAGGLAPTTVPSASKVIPCVTNFRSATTSVVSQFGVSFGNDYL